MDEKEKTRPDGELGHDEAKATGRGNPETDNDMGKVPLTGAGGLGNEQATTVVPKDGTSYSWNEVV